MSCVWTDLQPLQEEEPLCSRLPNKPPVRQLSLECNEDANSGMNAMSVTLDSEACQDTINTVNEKAAQPRRADATAVYATVQIDGIPVRFQLDTGASCNVIRVKDLGQISRARLTPTRKVLRIYGGSKATPKGLCQVDVENSKTHMVLRMEFVVIEEAPVALLGLTACQQLKLIGVHH